MGRVIGNVIGFAAVALVIVALNADSVDNLEAGDCFDDPTELEGGRAEVSRIDTKDCTKPHDNEVFAVVEMHYSSWPGESGAERFAAEACLDEFEPYVDRSYQNSRLDIGWLTPTSESWSSGDKSVTCFLYDMEFQKLTQEMENSRE